MGWIFLGGRLLHDIGWVSAIGQICGFVDWPVQQLNRVCVADKLVGRENGGPLIGRPFDNGWLALAVLFFLSLFAFLVRMYFQVPLLLLVGSRKRGFLVLVVC